MSEIMIFDEQMILDKFGDFLHKKTDRHGGTQLIFKFDNNYGASLLNTWGSYGNEIAILRFEGEKFELTYDTPIASDVIGDLTDSEILKILKDIKELE